MAFFGRDGEQAALADHLARACAGHGRVVAVEGPAGIGRTSLARWLRVPAQEAGARWLGGVGSETEERYPFGVVGQLFEPVDRDGLLDGQAEPARAALEGAPEAVAGPDGGFAVMRALYRLLAHLCERSPVVVCVDDLHLADVPSRRFLDHLGLRAGELPLLVVVTTRTGHDVPDGAHPMRLGPLARADVAAIAVDRMREKATGALVEALHEASGGNPFLLSELLGDLQSTGGRAVRVHDLVPASVVRSVRRRLERVPPAGVALAHAAAILGDEAGMADATAIAGLDSDRATAAADALVDADVLAPGRPLRFVHPVVRRAVRATLPAAQRSALHNRAVGHLAVIPGQIRVAAVHAMAAVPAADPVLVAVLRRAAAEARRCGMPDDAAAFLRRALEEPPPYPMRPAILLELADAAALVGDPDALEVARAAFAAARDPDGRLTAAILLGHLLTLRNRPDEAARVVVAATSATGVSPQLAVDAENVMLIWGACTVAARLETLERTAEAIARASEVVDDAPPALAAVASFFAALGHGTADQAAGLARRALASGGLLSPAGPLAPLLHLPTLALIVARQAAAAERGATDVMIHGSAHGSLGGTFVAFTLRAWARLQLADLAGALSDVGAAQDAARAGEIGAILHPLAAAVQGWVLLEMGRTAEARAAVEGLAGASRDPGIVTAARWYEVRARLLMDEGRFEDALVDLHVCATWERDWRAQTGAWTEWRTLAARCHAAAGRTAVSLVLLGEARDLAAEFGADALLGIVGHAVAMIDPRADRVAQLRGAMSLLEAGDARLEALRARVDLGEALAASGAKAEARRTLSSALGTAESCGAGPLAERARRALVTTGARPRRRAVSGAASLTAAERRVAELAAGGATNREIATDLHLTGKTVENHLTSTYRKLEIASRTQLAEGLRQP